MRDNVVPYRSDVVTMEQGIRVAASAWPDVERRLAEGDLALLPIGAACKEHGRHLPMDTDFRQAEWIAAQVLARRAAVQWPTLGYGYYPVFVDYPGSITLDASTFRAVVGEILDGIARAGARRVAVLNTGISTIAPLEALVEARAGLPDVCLVNVYAGPAFARASAALEQQSFGGHADEIETSIMLAIAPESVRLELARPAPQRIVRGLFNRSDPAAPNYSPDGVNGDPTRATRAKGEQLVAALIEDVIDALDAVTRRGATRGSAPRS